MVEFELINIKRENHRFTVEVEIKDTRERKSFGYPIGEGWELEIEGEPKFLIDIKRKIHDLDISAKMEMNIESIKRKYQNKKLISEEKPSKNKVQEDPKVKAKG